MVTWHVNGTTVTVQKDGGIYVVSGPDGPVGRPNLNAALGWVTQILHRLLEGATGTSGWSLTVQFPQIFAAYGDARRGGGGGQGGGRPPDVVSCAKAIYEPMSHAHPAVDNSIEIVRSCWDAAASAA
jgi:hypothetical protein